MIEFLSEYLSFQEIFLEITLGCMLMGITFLFPFREMSARPEVGWDIVGMLSVYVFALFYSFFEYPAYHWLANIDWIERWQDIIWIMPWWIVIPLNFVVADFAAYWAHRLLHGNWFWPTHAWHHAPKNLYWLSGLRGSLVHTLLTLFPYSVIYLFIPTPDVGIVITVIMVVNILNQHYIHSNIRLPFQKQLEFIFVTSRFHFVHHSSTRIRTDSNYGFVFSCWDRLFATYTDPDTVDNNDPLGLYYEISNIRLLLGIPAAKTQRATKDFVDNNLGK